MMHSAIPFARSHARAITGCVEQVLCAVVRAISCGVLRCAHGCFWVPAGVRTLAVVPLQPSASIRGQET